MIKNQYYRQISETPELSDEEINELFELKDNGNIEAREKLIRYGMKFINQKINTDFRGSKIPFDDLFQLGCNGVISAIDGNYSGENKFKNYILTCIENAIRGYEVRLSWKKRDSSNDISMNFPLYITGDGMETIFIEDTIIDPYANIENIVVDRIMRQELIKIISKLSQEEIWLLYEHFINGRTISDISRELKLPRPTLESKRKKLLMKLRHPNSMSLIKDILRND